MPPLFFIISHFFPFVNTYFKTIEAQTPAFWLFLFPFFPAVTAGFLPPTKGGQSRRNSGRGRANGGRGRGRRQTDPADRGRTRAGEAAGERAGQKRPHRGGVGFQLFLIVSRGAGGLWANLTLGRGARGGRGAARPRRGHPHRRPRANRHRPRAGKRRPQQRPTANRTGRGAGRPRRRGGGKHRPAGT